MRLNFSEKPAAQDMLVSIGREKGITPQEIIDLCICPKIYQRIVKTGWGSIALDLWGHDDFEREWGVLKNPIIDAALTAEQTEMLQQLQETEKVDAETAVMYFLLFQMEALGHHV